MDKGDAVQLIRRNPVGAACGVIALLLGGWTYFRADAEPALEAEFAQRQSDAVRLGNNVKHAVQLREQLRALQAANKAIDARVVRAVQVGANSQFFYRLESETGVKLRDLRPAPVVPPAKGAKSPFVAVGFSVSAEGSYGQLLDFLRRIEEGPHYSRILTASLSASVSDRRAPLTLALNVELLGLP